MKNLPNDFNWKRYIELNKDISHITNENEAVQHYINHGINENRLYKYKIPKDFHWKTYLFLNDDLQMITDEYIAIKHYCVHGRHECRDYKFNLPMDFDWKEYLKLNPDLNSIDNKKDAVTHYVSIGCRLRKRYSRYTLETEELIKFPDPIMINSPTNYIHYSSNSNKHIDESNILLTKPFFKIEGNQPIEKNEEYLYNIGKFMLIIDFPNGGGGTTFFLNTITSVYKYYQTFIIIRNINDVIHIYINDEIEITKKFMYSEFIEFLNTKLSSFDKIFINHTLNHDKRFLNYIMNINKQIYYITHDYSLLSSVHQPLYHQLNNYIQRYNESEGCVANPKLITHLITQHSLSCKIFNNIYKDQIKVINLPDYKQTLDKYDSNNKGIVIGIIGNIIEIKGMSILEKIQTYYLNEKNVTIVIFGHTKSNICKNKHCYNNIRELNELLIKFKPNALLELSLWPETWCYTLTLSMLTKLPIFYLHKNFPSVVTERLKKYIKAYKFSTISELNLLIKKNKQQFFYTIKPEIVIEKFWDKIFIDTYHLKQMSSVVKSKPRNGIKPYFIYFPQFHSFEENNHMFYENYTDIENLALYNKNNTVTFEEPNFEYYQINKNTDYKLINNALIKKQFDLIEYYNYPGFAVYYYWFSNNSVSESNMLMREAIDNLFNCESQLNLFFIWANEDWTNNLAFGHSKNIELSNTYNIDSFANNLDNLKSYFHHPKYLKIDNKPVFFIYHDYLFPDKKAFIDIAKKKCIEFGFAGINIVFNQFGDQTNILYEDVYKFYINFNYKKNPSRFIDNGQIKLDYNEYLNNDKHFDNNFIQTIVWDFNNKARLYKPDRLDSSTVCINNTEINKILFSEKILDCYNEEKSYKKRSEVEQILLINAFNEWGEKMTFEPSNEYGFYNLNMLKAILFK